MTPSAKETALAGISSEVPIFLKVRGSLWQGGGGAGGAFYFWRRDFILWGGGGGWG